MVTQVNFERGDIVRVNLNPAQGKEQQGHIRPALVLTNSIFNEMGMVLIAPITQGGNFARYVGFTASLDGSGTQTQGVVLINQVRMVDLKARNARRIERAPDFIVEDVLARLQAILE